MHWSEFLPAAAETTTIPDGDDAGRIGALMYLACIAHPATTNASHRKRDAYMTAIGEYIAGARAYSLGRRRLPRGSRPVNAKRERLFAILNRADHLIHMRLKLAGMAYSLRGKRLTEGSFSVGSLRIGIYGPTSLAKAMDQLAGRDSRTWWRIWKQSLPVMHLVLALRHATADISLGRDPLSLTLIRYQQKWLRGAIRRAPFEAVT